MISKRTLAILVGSLLLLPIAIVLILAVRALLGELGDAAGALVAGRVALALGLLWAFGIVGLLLALGMNSLGPPDHT